MSSSPASSNFSSAFVGKWTGVAISLVVILCIGLIGLSGYVKYELDHAELLLASPEVQLSPEQQAFDKVRRDLGYSGFVGLAQNYLATKDPAILSDMRADLKQASESIEHLPAKTNAETRHDLQAILATFESAMQKAEKSTAASTPPVEFLSSDVMPLYAALPVLDARVASAIASNRLETQNQAQLWATMLTLISWASLIIASALAAGMFLVLRDRNSAPMRALAQSVKNMARGDMRTSIWGMERQDAIGELARSVDMARFHFSQLPDMSLLSEQGPVRIKFEGNTRSLFEAMMRVIARDSEQVHAQAAALTEAVNGQQETLSHVIERVEAVLQNVEKRAISGDQQVRQALQGMLGSAESLKNAQEHASDQLNRIIPFLQERTQGISDIAQITGKQVAQALQALAQSERGIKASAEQSSEAIRKFSTTADTLGERMFGAINLLQASGRVLAETTQSAKSKFASVFERFENMQAPSGITAIAAPPALDNNVAERLEEGVVALEVAHKKLESLLAEQSETTRMHIDLLTTQSGGLLTQASTSSQTLSSAADRLRDEQVKLAELIGQFGVELQNMNKPADTTHAVYDVIAPLSENLKDGFATLEQRMSSLHSQLATLLQQSVQKPEDKSSEFNDQMRDHWYQMAAQIEATRSNLAQVIMQQTDRVEAYLANVAKVPEVAGFDKDFVRDAQSQMEQQTQILNELVSTLCLLDTHMQELRTQVSSKRAG